MRVLIIFILPLFLFACQQEDGLIESETVCLFDCTDSSIGKLPFSQILPLVNVTNNNNGSTFRIKYISDVDFTQRTQVELLPKVHIHEETDQDRYIMKMKYLKKVESKYSQFEINTSHKNHSIIYRIVANELIELSKSKAQRKVLIIHSDLMENSDILNLYIERDVIKLLSQPRSIRHLFQREVKISSLSGVEVYFTFIPKDFAQNRVYSSMYKVYKEIILNAGGECFATLPSS